MHNLVKESPRLADVFSFMCSCLKWINRVVGLHKKETEKVNLVPIFTVHLTGDNMAIHVYAVTDVHIGNCVMSLPPTHCIIAFK